MLGVPDTPPDEMADDLNSAEGGSRPQSFKNIPFRDVLRYFLWLGALGFGGPIATVGYMQRDLVEKRRWLDRDDFLNGVALGQTMPGPLAAQVSMWVGYLRAGALGALAMAVPFICPRSCLLSVSDISTADIRGCRSCSRCFTASLRRSWQSSSSRRSN